MKKIGRPLSRIWKIGEVYHDVVITGFVSKVHKGNKVYTYVESRCKCGKILRCFPRKVSKSCHDCECLIHNYSRTSVYKAWQRFRQSCYNKNYFAYRYTGALGIVVCDEWKEKTGFVQFLKDVGDKPSESCKLSRIDKSGNFEPGNVEWRELKVKRFGKI